MFSKRQSKNAVDLLYKLNAETLSAESLKSLLLERGQSTENLGSLKRLEKLLKLELPA
jgi:hypothetical protein